MPNLNRYFLQLLESFLLKKNDWLKKVIWRGWLTVNNQAEYWSLSMFFYSETWICQSSRQTWWHCGNLTRQCRVLSLTLISCRPFQDGTEVTWSFPASIFFVLISLYLIISIQRNIWASPPRSPLKKKTWRWWCCPFIFINT